MKKRMIAVVCAFVMALALPMLASAAPSPTSFSGSGSAGGVTVNYQGTGSGSLIIDESNYDGNYTTLTSAITVGANQKLFGPFSVYKTGDTTFSSVTLSFYVGTAYNGCKATIYQLGADESTPTTYTATVSNGSVSCTVSTLSSWAVLVDTTGASSTNGGATSPKTGLAAPWSMTILLGAGVVAACAGIVLITRRNRIHE